MVHESPYNLKRDPMLVGTFPGEHDPNRLEQHQHIKNEGMIFNIVQVVLKLLNRVIHGSTVVIADLSPSSNTWFYTMPDCIKRNISGKLINKIWTLWARSDQAHFPQQNIDQLRKFVNAGPADDSANTRDRKSTRLNSSHNSNSY